MSIVNREGRLFKLKDSQDSNKRGKLQFELVEGAPRLKWDSVMDSTCRVTTDGKIYLPDDNRIFETEETGFKHATMERSRRSDITVTGLLDDGRLVEYRSTGECEVIDTDVEFMGDIDVEYTVYKELREGRLSIDQGEYGTIIDVNNDIIITNTHIGYRNNCDGLTFMKRRGTLIGVANLNMYIGRTDSSNDHLLVVEEEDGELITRQCDVEGIDNDDCVHINDDLCDMHQQCPWVDLITYDNEPHLVNANGHSVRIVDQFGTVASKIPAYIFASPMVKNARSSESVV